MKRICLCVILLGVLGLWIFAVPADEEHHSSVGHRSEESIRSTGGDNPWNQGQEPEDWWGAIKRTHGHVGPWNVLGWRIGRAALREFDTEWGRHEVDIICYIPLDTPYSCMADGIVLGTGNSLGRLDIRLCEVMSVELIHIAVRRKDGTGPVLIFRPLREYLKLIEGRTVHELEDLSRQCSAMTESDLFRIERVVYSKTSK